MCNKFYIKYAFFMPAKVLILALQEYNNHTKE